MTAFFSSSSPAQFRRSLNRGVLLCARFGASALRGGYLGQRNIVFPTWAGPHLVNLANESDDVD